MTTEYPNPNRVTVSDGPHFVTGLQPAPDPIRIYVASLSAYNAGTLHGEWIDATQDADDIWAEVQAMLKACPENNRHGCPSEEWAIHDFEGFGSWSPSESESFETVAQVAELIEEHGEAFTIYAEDVGVEQAAENFAEAYYGEWESGADFAENWYAETMGEEALGPLVNYVDWEHVWKSEFDCNSYSIEDGHVFRPV